VISKNIFILIQNLKKISSKLRSLIIW